MYSVRFYPLVGAIFVVMCGAGCAVTPSAQNVTSASTPVSANSPEVVDGYLKVGFDRLTSFPFVGDLATVSATASDAQIPADIKKLNGRKVIVSGFLLPIKMVDNDTLTTEFLLLKNQLCFCSSNAAPQANEWILVEMPKGVKPQMDVPISFRGTLHVGAMFENGYLTGIYSLDGE
jgi:hypothetical protein